MKVNLKKLAKSDVIKSKSIVKKSTASITIQNNKPAEYVPVYFQAELKQSKEDMGFWK